MADIVDLYRRFDRAHAQRASQAITYFRVSVDLCIHSCTYLQIAAVAQTSTFLRAFIEKEGVWKAALANEFAARHLSPSARTTTSASTVPGLGSGGDSSAKRHYQTPPPLVGDAGGLPLAPGPGGSLPSLYAGNRAAARLDTVAWEDPHVVGSERGSYVIATGWRGPAPHPGAREGTAWAPVGGGDALVLIGGWTDRQPGIRNDVWMLDCNPLGALGTAEYDQEAAAIGVPEYTVAEIRAAAWKAGSSAYVKLKDGPAYTAGAVAQDDDPELEELALMAGLRQRAAALLASRSPTRTGTIPRLSLRWSEATPGEGPSGNGERPRPLYGHCATSVLLTEQSVQLARERHVHAAAAGGSSASSSSSSSSNCSGSAASSASIASYPPYPSSHPSLGVSITHPTTGSRLPAPIHPSTAASLAVAGGNLNAPSAEKSTNSSNSSGTTSAASEVDCGYGSPPAGWVEGVLVTGGMRSGGYTNETGEVWLLVCEVTIDVQRVPAAEYLPISGRGRDEDDEKGGEKKNGDDGDDDMGGERPSASSTSSFSATASPSTEGAERRLWKYALSRRLRCEWIRIHLRNEEAAPSSSAKGAAGTSSSSSRRTAEEEENEPRRPGCAIARGYHAAAFVPARREVWVTGGIGRGDSLWAPEAFDLDTWTIRPIVTSLPPTLARQPPPRHGHVMVPLNGRVWLLCGGTGGDILREGWDLRDCWCYDLTLEVWAKVTYEQPKPQSAPASAAAEGGGGDAAMSDTHAAAAPSSSSSSSLSSSSSAATAPLVPPTVGAAPSWAGRLPSAVAVGQKILVFGGNTSLSNRLFVVDTSAAVVAADDVTGVPLVDASYATAASNRAGAASSSSSDSAADVRDDDAAGSGASPPSQAAGVVPVGGVVISSPRSVIGHNGRHCPWERYNACAARVGRRVFFYGGWSDGDPLGDITVLDLAPQMAPAMLQPAPLLSITAQAAAAANSTNSSAVASSVAEAAAREARRWLGLPDPSSSSAPSAGDTGRGAGSERAAAAAAAAADADDDDDYDDKGRGGGGGKRRRLGYMPFIIDPDGDGTDDDEDDDDGDVRGLRRSTPQLDAGGFPIPGSSSGGGGASGGRGSGGGIRVQRGNLMAILNRIIAGDRGLMLQMMAQAGVLDRLGGARGDDDEADENDDDEEEDEEGDEEEDEEDAEENDEEMGDDDEKKEMQDEGDGQ